MMMKSLVENFGKQLKEAMEIGEKATLNHSAKPVLNVLVNGMGGSGIGGTIISELVSPNSKIPISVNKGYSLPGYVNENSLIIISSYSGNTEETIEALNSAIEKKAKIVCIASGGKIIAIAKENKIDYIEIPTGMPPRAAVGYSMVQLLFILYRFGIIDESFKKELEQGISLISKEEENIKAEAREISEKLLGKLPVIYAPAGSEGVAVRLRQELNENSKALGWHHVLSEMNHNELLAWSEKNDKLAVIFFRNDSDYSRIAKRIDLTKDIIKKYTDTMIEIHSKGNSPLERTIYSIHLGDWISVYLALAKKIDADEMAVIEDFKASLSKF